MLAGLVGCGPAAPSIKIDGSSTVYPLSEAVAEEFTRSGARVNVTVGQSGTGGGFKKFSALEIDLCDASRPIKPDEAKRCVAAGLDYLELVVAYDGIAIVVHPDNDWCAELSVDQLAAIWRPDGPVRRWNELDPAWPDHEIRLYGPGTDSGTFDYFTEEIVGEPRSCRPDFTASEDDNVLVTGISKDRHALGYFGFAYYEENAERLGLVGVKPTDDAAAVLPSLETIRSNAYTPLSRPLLVYVGRPVLERSVGLEFVRFYLANAGGLATEVGYVPVPTEIAEKNLQKLNRALTATVEPTPKVGASSLSEVPRS
ncbi:PstS family phosphate ABC transporter substrate-binding protein [Botrimarina hoheduenensis]|uniref:Phosphate-binding protein n=1 Tax=Botrimarina hoheduenensis TaxID=2528000 RepID=A0A5C5W0N9_9BACT|nr:PstS family phosphate ABC transporter substrate-binding protein [Botrimarina hoheduenensis]TWT43342.1 Phosphate-binding protein PstS precursor [Botrimarina hoheduenensis]